MMIKLWGRFFDYTPEAEDVAHLRAGGVIFSRNEGGTDFYDLHQQFTAGSVLASVDDDGLICGAGYSPRGMLPLHGMRLVELSGSDVPATLREIVGRVVDFAEGVLLAKPIIPESVPTISPSQIRRWLLSRGLYAQVPILIGAMPEPDKSAAQIEWDYATEFRHDHPLIKALGAAVGLTEQDIEAGFREAALL